MLAPVAAGGVDLPPWQRVGISSGDPRQTQAPVIAPVSVELPRGWRMPPRRTERGAERPHGSEPLGGIVWPISSTKPG